MNPSLAPVAVRVEEETSSPGFASATPLVEWESKLSRSPKRVSSVDGATEGLHSDDYCP